MSSASLRPTVGIALDNGLGLKCSGSKTGLAWQDTSLAYRGQSGPRRLEYLTDGVGRVVLPNRRDTISRRSGLERQRVQHGLGKSGRTGAPRRGTGSERRSTASRTRGTRRRPPASGSGGRRRWPGDASTSAGFPSSSDWRRARRPRGGTESERPRVFDRPLAEARRRAPRRAARVRPRAMDRP